MVSLKSPDELIPPADDFTFFDRVEKVRGCENDAIANSVYDHEFGRVFAEMLENDVVAVEVTNKNVVF